MTFFCFWWSIYVEHHQLLTACWKAGCHLNSVLLSPHAASCILPQVGRSGFCAKINASGMLFFSIHLVKAAVGTNYIKRWSGISSKTCIWKNLECAFLSFAHFFIFLPTWPSKCTKEHILPKDWLKIFLNFYVFTLCTPTLSQMVATMVGSKQEWYIHTSHCAVAPATSPDWAPSGICTCLSRAS